MATTEDASLEFEAAYENLKDVALTPYHILTSKPAKRTYLTTILLFITSIFLLLTAILAYGAFYYTYIPSLGFSRPVHLQFSPFTIIPPSGIVSLFPDVASQQPYDISVRLTVPRTPANIAAGNFMLDVSLLGYDDVVIAHSSRTACLTYRSPIFELLSKVARLPVYALGWRTESETLTVGMFEELEFAKGWRGLPGKLRLEMQGETRVQVYGAEVRFQTRFNGVRWLMYNHRTLAFVIFTSIFWVVELAFTIPAYLLIAVVFTRVFGSPSALLEPKSKSSAAGLDIEQDDSDESAMSDTSRTFPTSSKQPPLRYSPAARIKQEEDVVDEEEEKRAVMLQADDEDEEDDDFVFDHGVTAGARSDSGLGTSMESSAGSSRSVRRRKTKGKNGGI